MSGSHHKRRAKKHGRLHVKFQAVEIFERDNWICQCGCGRPCDKLAKFPHPDAATEGHIIALSAGGDHTRENVRCERWECNERINRERDTPIAAKIKRQRLETGQQARRERRKAEGKPSLIQSLGKLVSRGFQKNPNVKRQIGTGKVVPRDR